MKLTEKVQGNTAIAYISTDVSYQIPRDGNTYTIKIPINNFRDDLFYDTSDSNNISLAFNQLDSNGVLIDVTVSPLTSLGAKDLIIETAGGYTNENLNLNLSNNASSRIEVVAASQPFKTLGSDVTNLFDSSISPYLNTAIKYDFNGVGTYTIPIPLGGAFDSNTVISSDLDATFTIIKAEAAGLLVEVDIVTLPTNGLYSLIVTNKNGASNTNLPSPLANNEVDRIEINNALPASAISGDKDIYGKSSAYYHERFSGNLTPTNVSGSLGVFIPFIGGAVSVGNTVDNWERLGDGNYRYIGNWRTYSEVEVTATFLRATGGGSDAFQIAIFKNAIPVPQCVATYRIEGGAANARVDQRTIFFQDFFDPLDDIEVRVRSITTGDNIAVSEYSIVINEITKQPT